MSPHSLRACFYCALSPFSLLRILMKKTLATALFSFSALFVTYTQASSTLPSLNRMPVYSDQSNNRYDALVSSPSVRQASDHKNLSPISSSNEPTCLALTLSCMGKERYEKFFSLRNERTKAQSKRFWKKVVLSMD